MKRSYSFCNDAKILLAHEIKYRNRDMDVRQPVYNSFQIFKIFFANQIRDG